MPATRFAGVTPRRGESFFVLSALRDMPKANRRRTTTLADRVLHSPLKLQGVPGEQLSDGQLLFVLAMVHWA